MLNVLTASMASGAGAVASCPVLHYPSNLLKSRGRKQIPCNLLNLHTFEFSLKFPKHAHRRRIQKCGSGLHAATYRLQVTAEEKDVALETSKETLEVVPEARPVSRGKKRRSKKLTPEEREKRRAQAVAASTESAGLADTVKEVLYGEEGALFWLNKLAYGSIFVLVGAWILFRFVGPSLGLYDLENPLLPPDQAFFK